MSEYKTFKGPTGTTVVIEVETEDIEGIGGEFLSDMMRVLQDIAFVTSDSMQRLNEAKKPNEYELAFGLKGLSEGGVAVSLGDDHANFHVRMKWGSASGGDGLADKATMTNSEAE